MAKYSPVKKSSVVKTAKKVYKLAKGRYAGKNLGSNIKNIISDVAMMKSLLNVEKKHVTVHVANAATAQLSGNVSGLTSQDITPIMSQGTTAETRTGNSIKLTSQYIQLQFHHQTNTSAPTKGCVYIFKCVGRANLNAFNAAAEIWKYNPFIGTGINVIDYNSQRNQDYFKDFILVRKKNFRVACDSLTGQQQITNVSIPLRYKNHHVKFDNNTNVVTSGQLYMYILLDSGNVAGTASTLTGVPVTQQLSGLLYSMNLQSFYVDN